MEHLTYDEIEAWIDGRATDVERELVEGHIELCALCRTEVRDLERVRESIAARHVRWLPAIAAAAAVLIAIVAAWFLAQKSLPTGATGSQPVIATTEPSTTTTAPAPPPPPVLYTLQKPPIIDTLARNAGVLRGHVDTATFALHEPVGTVVLDARPRFRWDATPGAGTYTVAIADRETGGVAATESIKATTWQPKKSLKRGRTYSWQVTAQLGEERVTVPRPSDPEALFHVATQEEAAAIEAMQKGHLEMGVELAERGVLDDAERELRLAKEAGEAQAGTLLE
ncbi:MAG: anti-sigma factor family protein, partial [Thermoanaerobaculia bacterium]